MDRAHTETSPLLQSSEHQAEVITVPVVSDQCGTRTPSDEEATTTLTGPCRVHWLDNLRTSLTVILIFQHAVVETAGSWRYAGYPLANALPLYLFITLNRTLVWTLFFFVSGYSAHLSLTTNSSDLAFLKNRTLHVGLPALTYGLFIRPFLFLFLTALCPEVFGNWKQLATFTRLAGPVQYVAILIAFDYTFLATRWLRPQYSNASLWTSYSYYHRVVSAMSFSTLCASAFVSLTFTTFLGCMWHRRLVYTFNIVDLPYDIPAPDAPLSFLIAYIAGVNFRAIQTHIVIRPLYAWIGSISSLLLAVTSLGVAQHLFPALQNYVIGGRSGQDAFFKDGGFNLHTIFFSLWDAFVFLVVQTFIIFAFSQAAWVNRNYGFFTRHTYPLTYINAIPITAVCKSP